MGENNGGAGMKKADLLILKVDRLAKQTATVDAKLTAVVNNRDGSNTDAITRLTEENQALKQELRYLAAQTESVYSNLAGLISKLNSEIEDLKKAPVSGANLDLDELSSKVAEKIVIPRSQGDIDYNFLAARVAERVSSRDVNVEVDSEQVAQKVVEKLSGTTAKDNAQARLQASENTIDVEELGNKIVSSMYIPKAIVEDIDYDTLSSKLAAKLNLGERVTSADGATVVAPAIDYDELGTRIVSNMYIPKAIVEDIDYDTLTSKLAQKLPVSDKSNVVYPASYENIDYDTLGSKIVNNMYIPKAVVEDIDYESLAGKIDYDTLSSKIAERINVGTVAETPANVSVDYDELSKKVAQNISGNIVVAGSTPASIDYEELAQKLANALPANEVISPDYIASKVAEQIVVPAVEAQSPEIDIETLSRKIADKIAIPAVDVPEVVVDEDKIATTVAEKVIAAREEEEKTASANIDEQALATALAEKLNISLSDEIIADAVVKNLANAIDSEEIADCVAKKVGSISPEQFDVMVDDDGCESLAKNIVEKLDCAYIANTVSEKLTPIIMSNSVDIDTEELAKTLSDKISVSATVNEDVIADKAAAVLSNYLPEIDSDDIADKVVAGVIPSIPAAPVIDYDTITNSVTERLIENQEDKDFDIVIDDEGLSHITENISGELKQEYSQRLDSVDADVDNIKTEIENIKSLIESRSDETREQNSTRLDSVDADFDNIQSQIDEIKNLIESNNTQAMEQHSNRLDGVDGEIENIKSELAEIKALLQTSSSQQEEVVAVQPEDNSGRFDSIENEISDVKQYVTSGEITKELEEKIEELKKLVLSGVVISSASSEIASASAEAKQEEVDEADEENEELVTVSDIVAEDGETSEEESDEVIGAIIDDIDEAPSDGEIMPDGIYGISNSAVDFASMMKYNRSFIARIIQGSDEVKQYYGEVKSTLLSYKKVNSNIAWGAERFNKGRETIAKFKIRGKTLCLYLALDPKEYKTSVYHHSDVSDNKSMHGTPMMVKIKSPLGVKKAVRLIDEMLAKRDGIKQPIKRRDYAAMYPYESIEELIDDGLVKDVSKK